MKYKAEQKGINGIFRRNTGQTRKRKEGTRTMGIRKTR